MTQRSWPADGDLLDLFRAHGGNAAAVGRAVGVRPTTLKDHVGRRRLRAQVEEIRQNAAAPLAEDVPVDDPARIRADQTAAELKALKRENEDYRKALARQEAFFDRIVEATRVPVAVSRYKAATQDSRKPRRSVVAPVYDQQFGQFVRAQDTANGKGDFSVATFDKRLARWVDGLTGMLRDEAHAHHFDELIIPLGGDQVEGDEIFPGQPWQLELDPPQQVWQLACKMEAALREVIAFAKTSLGIPKIGIYSVPGNHGKVGGKRGGARPSTYSWDWLFSMILRDKLRGEPIDKFQIEPGGQLLFGAADFIFLMIHGDEIRGWGGLPFYGLTRFDGRAMRLHRVLYDYLLLGHHHQPASIPNGSGESIVSGDWVGATNLSRAMTAASRPRQEVLFVAKKWGITDAKRIWFTDALEAHEPATIHRTAA